MKRTETFWTILSGLDPARWEYRQVLHRAARVEQAEALVATLIVFRRTIMFLAWTGVLTAVALVVCGWAALSPVCVALASLFVMTAAGLAFADTLLVLMVKKLIRKMK